MSENDKNSKISNKQTSTILIKSSPETFKNRECSKKIKSDTGSSLPELAPIKEFPKNKTLILIFFYY